MSRFEFGIQSGTAGATVSCNISVSGKMQWHGDTLTVWQRTARGVSAQAVAGGWRSSLGVQGK